MSAGQHLSSKLRVGVGGLPACPETLTGWDAGGLRSGVTGDSCGRFVDLRPCETRPAGGAHVRVCQAVQVPILAGATMLAAIAWVYLLAGHGGYWRTDQRLPRGSLDGAAGFPGPD